MIIIYIHTHTFAKQLLYGDLRQYSCIVDWGLALALHLVTQRGW